MTAEEERNQEENNDAGDQSNHECWSCPTHAAVTQAASMATIIVTKRYGTSIAMKFKKDHTRFLKRLGTLALIHYAILS